MLKTGPFVVENHQRQSGFTLLEVLITLIVLSIGLLGLAGLQVVSLRNNHTAYLRTQAITQSYDIVDRMRANSDQTTIYLGPNPTTANDSYAFNTIGTQTTACDSAGGCTPAQMAGHDLFKWNQANRGTLPLGIGIICRDDTTDDGSYDAATDKVTTGCTNTAADPLVVKIWWVDDRAGDPPVPSRFSMVIGDQL